MALNEHTQSGIATSVARRNVIGAITLVFGADVAMGLTYPLLNLLLEARGVDERIIGLNAAMSPLGIIVMGVILPRLVAKRSSAPIAWIAMACLAASILAMGWFTSLPAWFAIRFALGAAAGALFTLSEAWLMHFTADENRGRTTAIYTTVMATGFGAGTAILPFAGTEGMLPFVMGAAFIAVGSLPLLLIRLDGSEFKADESGEKTGMIVFALAAPLLLLGVLTMTLFDSIMLSFFPIYAVRLSLELSTAAWLLGAAVAGAALFQLPIGWLADRWSRRGVIWIATLGTCSLALSMPLVIKTWLAWPLAVALGTCAYALYSLALVALGDRFKGPMLVAGSAAVAAMWGIGGIIGPSATGWIFKVAGHETLPYVLAAPYVVFAVLLAVSGGHLVRQSWRKQL
ncbi:MFS transporter [Anderseniella sp. Alg231-50]|uniref:MFS transporter n=1 Tax=Anderseniella sp. Alg231-50 TaxID=1922226 RepID=UPI000D55AAFF